jgi:hypothetical protein
MKRQVVVRPKADRRRHDDRRFQTRAGRRDQDPSPSTRCPACRSRQVQSVRVTYGVHEYRCWACHESWAAIPKRH